MGLSVGTTNAYADAWGELLAQASGGLACRTGCWIRGLQALAWRKMWFTVDFAHPRANG